MSVKRRTVLLGGGAVALVAAVPLVQGGISGYLTRVLKEHFGDDVTGISGVQEFVGDYASLVARHDTVKQTGANVYFALRGEQIKELGLAADLEKRFLQTILTRSNIIAVRQGKSTEFEYSDADPWALVCGSYLSAEAL